MMLSISVSKRVRTRTLKSGIVTQHRYVLDYKDPVTHRRRQEFFERKSDAENRRVELLTPTVPNPRLTPVPAPARPHVLASEFAPTPPQHAEKTVGDVVDYWLQSLDARLKDSTRGYYTKMARYVISPTPFGTAIERRRWSRAGQSRAFDACVPGLGALPVSELTTQSIRSWHALLVEHVGTHTANAAKKLLASAIRLASEELGLRPPVVPRTPQRRKGVKTKRKMLTLDQVRVLMQAALEDEDRGIYYAFPFLTGVRPSEQLGLLWRDVDLAKGLISIRRMQEVDGTLCNLTKTEASTREIPISPLLKQLLERWRSATPTGALPDSRVFVQQGSGRSSRHGAGAPLTYWNFRNTYWRPTLQRLGLPTVGPHSARHLFISTLQARGAEIGLVAKLAGHANPNITLGYYTQAVRDGAEPIAELEQAYVRTGREKLRRGDLTDDTVAPQPSDASAAA